MFFGKKKKAPQVSAILAPANGLVISVAEVPDPVFSDKILGDGAAIIPHSNQMLSPVSGTVTNVAETLHAYGIETPDGLEVLIHIGLNTVELQGKHFTCHVKEGQSIQAGDPLCDVDFDQVEAAGYEIHTPVLITNLDSVKSFAPVIGETQAGNEIIRYERS